MGISSRSPGKVAWALARTLGREGPVSPVDGSSTNFGEGFLRERASLLCTEDAEELSAAKPQITHRAERGQCRHTHKLGVEVFFLTCFDLRLGFSSSEPKTLSPAQQNASKSPED